jgi:hypothetical protein
LFIEKRCTARLTFAACVLARRGFPITQATDRNLACEVLESGMTTLLFTCPNTGSRVQAGSQMMGLRPAAMSMKA